MVAKLPLELVDMAVERFHENEEAYTEWLEANPRGFVFNKFGGCHAKYNVLHRAVVSRNWWKLRGAGTEWAWWSPSGSEVKVVG